MIEPYYDNVTIPSLEHGEDGGNNDGPRSNDGSSAASLGDTDDRIPNASAVGLLAHVEEGEGDNASSAVRVVVTFSLVAIDAQRRRHDADSVVVALEVVDPRHVEA